MNEAADLIFIWGTGQYGLAVSESVSRQGESVHGFIDNDPMRQGTQVHQKAVYPPTYLVELEQSGTGYFVYIASMYASEILAQLKDMGIYDSRKFFIALQQVDAPDSYYLKSPKEWSLLLAEFEASLRLPMNGQVQCVSMKDWDDYFWFYLNTEGYRNYPAVRECLSPLPEEQVQRRLTGASGDSSLRYGFQQYMVIKSVMARHRFDIDSTKQVLDFGVGYGRILRFFAKDFDHRRLFGTDVDRDLIEWCEAHNKFGTYTINRENPPTAYASDMFDLIFAFSVFSHLSEASSREWLKELKRVAKKDALILLTIWAHPNVTKEYHERHFPDYQTLVAQYDAGEYCYSDLLYGHFLTKGYGEALIPISYIEKHWSNDFQIEEIIVNHHYSPNQYYIVLRKR